MLSLIFTLVVTVAWAAVVTTNHSPSARAKDEVFPFVEYKGPYTSRAPPGGRNYPVTIAPGNPVDECTERIGEDPDTNDLWNFVFVKARCDRRLGGRRHYHVTCKNKWREPPAYNKEFSSGEDVFANKCLENQVCQDIIDVASGVETIRCVDADTVVTEHIRSAEVVHGSSAEADVYCTLTLALPGSHYQPVGRQTMNMVLTEEVFWPNGTAYDAPLLFIHDKTASWRGLDRAYRRNTNVASALIAIEWVRGKLQEKKIQFCMKMKDARNDMVVFMYSWFPMNHRGLID